MQNRHRLAAIGAVVAIGATAVIAPTFAGAEGAPTRPAPAADAVVKPELTIEPKATASAVATAAPSLFVPITPYRMYDSRGETEPWFPGQFATYDATTDYLDAPQIPTGVSGVTFNVTIVTLAGAGFVQILTPGGLRGETSTVNWATGNQFIANGGSVGLVGDGLEIYVGGTADAAVDIIIDVTGYYVAPA